jgi:hypothetical protein
MTEETTPENAWLDEVNKDADENAAQLSGSLNCKVLPYVFIIKDGEDAAIAYVKQPDALQSFKIMRSALESTIEAGRILVIKSQLIRELEGKQISDKRFMDVEGKYLPEDSNLNLGLMLAVNDLIEPVKNSFKKK